jgi:hypothetical protein
MNPLSRAEEIVLLAVYKLKNNANGVTIREQILLPNHQRRIEGSDGYSEYPRFPMEFQENLEEIYNQMELDAVSGIPSIHYIGGFFMEDTDD